MLNRKKFMRTFDKYSKIDMVMPSFQESISISMPTADDIKIKTWIEDDVLFIDGLLDKKWCDYVINLTDKHYESISDEFPQTIRDSKRFLTLNHDLAKTLWNKISDHVKKYFDDAKSPLEQKTNRPNIPFGFGVKGKWKPERINECFRFIKYDSPSKGFDPHKDSLYVEGFNKRSIYTMLIYLNDVEDSAGGKTSFIDFIEEKNVSSDTTIRTVTSSIRPRSGLIAIMCHNREHLGDPLISGKKYIIRSDIIFNCYERPDNYDENLWTNDDVFIKCVGLYSDAKRYEMNGDVVKASKCYEEGLAIRQSTYI
jgi:hypothetical protein